MCCGPSQPVAPPAPTCGCGCGCGPSASFRRRFLTKEERVQILKDYLADLRSETGAVEQAVAELESEG
jgi:hypothetical protein